MTTGAGGPGALVLGTSDRASAVAAVKALLRIETAGEDALIAGFAEAALGLAERFTGQVTIARAMTVTIRPSGWWQPLGVTPARAIGGVVARTAAGVDSNLTATEYSVDIDPSGCGWVRVAATGFATAAVSVTAGIADDWGGLPSPLRQGATMLAAHLFTTRDGGEAPPAAVTALWRPFRVVRLTRAAHS